MGYEKKRISLFLCILLMVSTVLLAIPQETRAASADRFVGMCAGTKEDAPEIRVCNGAQCFYAGDVMVFYEDDDYTKNRGYLSMLSGVTYASSNPTVAEIDDKTGKIATKMEGTTDITVTYKGQSQYFQLKVISKSSMEKALSADIRKSEEAVKKGAKIFIDTTGEVTSIKKSNRYKILSAYKSYKYGDSVGYYDYKRNGAYYIYSTEARHAEAICDALERYVKDRTAFSSEASNCFKVKSISGKGKTKKITIKLNKKVTDNQIFGANYAFSWDTELEKSNTYTFPIMVQDAKTKYQYYTIATMKQGSDKITIDTQNLRLKKGTKYKLIARYGTWLKKSVNKNTFKAS